MNEHIDIDSIKSESIGRWSGILAGIGFDVQEGRHIPCPFCGGKDRFRFDDKDGRGTWICNQCGAGDGFQFVEKLLSVDFVGAAKAVAPLINESPVAAVREESVSKEYLREIFTGSVRAHNSNLVGRYLASRGIKNIPKTLRFHRGLKEPDSGETFPCMIAVLSMPDGTAVTMHRTWIIEPGEKAPVNNCKKLLPGLKKLNGSAIRLMKVSGAGLIGVAEGIETALSCHELYNIPVWCAPNAILLESWVPPTDGSVKQVVVFGDNDSNYTGQKAAYMLGNKLVVQYGLNVDVEIPGSTGDFNDVLRGAI